MNELFAMHSGAYRVIETHCRGDYYIRHSIHVPKNIALRLYSSAEVPATPALTVGGSSNSGRGCSKCGITRKSGERSCCARGGTWFKNCGDADDKQFDHTWAEGIQACEGFAGLGLVDPPFEAILHHAEVNFYPANTVEPHVNINYSVNVSDVRRIDYAEYLGITKVSVYICALADLFVVQLHIYNS